MGPALKDSLDQSPDCSVSHKRRRGCPVGWVHDPANRRSQIPHFAVVAPYHDLEANIPPATINTPATETRSGWTVRHSENTTNPINTATSVFML